MRKSIFCVFCVLLTNNLFAQHSHPANRYYPASSTNFVATNVPVDSICIIEYNLQKTNLPDNNAPHELISYKFDKNGILRSSSTYNKEIKLTEKVETVVSDGKIILILTKYITEGYCKIEKKITKSDDTEKWGLSRINEIISIKDATSFNSFKDTMYIQNSKYDFKRIYSLKETFGNSILVNSYDDDNRLITVSSFKQFETLDNDIIGIDDEMENIYNNRGLVVKTNINRTSKQLEKKTVEIDVSLRTEYLKFDSQGNWTECIVKDDAGLILKIYTRQIFYHKN